MTALRPKSLGLERGNLLVVVTGAIAAASMPTQLEAIRSWYPEVNVRILITESAASFVTSTMLRVAGRTQVFGPGWFDGPGDFHVPHRQLAAWADAVVVMPASGNTVAKLACGIGDSLALATIQDAECLVVIVPAVSPGNLRRKIFTDNVARLRDSGYHVMDPIQGRRASDNSVGLGAPALLCDVLLTVARGSKILQSTVNLDDRRDVSAISSK